MRTDEQGSIPKQYTYRSNARHMVSTSIGFDASAVYVLAVYEQQADPADPFETSFDVVQLQRLHARRLRKLEKS
ncbi:MAG TPA: hypothetical protein VMS82_18380 [Pseudolabrys sp.]|nr:hypothetical protein [Pseudolabrys sp.]